MRCEIYRKCSQTDVKRFFSWGGKIGKDVYPQPTDKIFCEFANFSLALPTCWVCVCVLATHSHIPPDTHNLPQRQCPWTVEVLWPHCSLLWLFCVCICIFFFFSWCFHFLFYFIFFFVVFFYMFFFCYFYCVTKCKQFFNFTWQRNWCCRQWVKCAVQGQVRGLSIGKMHSSRKRFLCPISLYPSLPLEFNLRQSLRLAINLLIKVKVSWRRPNPKLCNFHFS